jgi:hypothetical protein
MEQVNRELYPLNQANKEPRAKEVVKRDKAEHNKQGASDLGKASEEATRRYKELRKQKETADGSCTDLAGRFAWLEDAMA